MSKAKFDNGLVQLYQADARDIPLPDESVHCVVTSPPYFGLRVYKTEDQRLIGLEESIEEYLESMVAVFREVKRVLRDDGVVFINMGDSYGGGNGGYQTNSVKQKSNAGTMMEPRRGDQPGNLLGVPWRLAMALQADGWILRDAIIWQKKSPMPESVNGWRWEKCQKRSWVDPVTNEELRRDRQNGRDFGEPKVEDCPGCDKCRDNDGLVLKKGSWRCTSSYEHIFMFVKGMGYFADGEAVRRANTEGTVARTATSSTVTSNGYERQFQPYVADHGANRRNVWNDIKSEPYGGEHFATFPPDLPRLCIQASTSEKGCCPKCGSQWTRVVSVGKSSWEARKEAGHNSGGYHATEGQNAIASYATPQRRKEKPNEGGLGWVAPKEGAHSRR